MNAMKLRRILILVHLYLASLLAPLFMLVAISGTLYLARVEAKVESTPIKLSQSAALDFKSTDLEADIRALMASENIDIDFEYIRGRGNMAMTRPTNRTHVKFQQAPNGLQASYEKPNLQYRLMEMHKGHGPTLFRKYQIFAGISLFLVVLGGLIVGLLAKNYRKPTLTSTSIGVFIFFVLGFII